MVIIENRKWRRTAQRPDAARKGKINTRSADNVLIAWPVLKHAIGEYQAGANRLLDYGCGTGEFCRHMRAEGFHVEGIDIAHDMIRAAQKDSPKEIRYQVGDKKALKNIEGKFNVITSIMVFQFIKDLDSYIPLFHDLLIDRGLVVFAVHNPDYVKTCCQQKMVFSSLRSAGDSHIARMKVEKGASVDTYVRSKEKYKRLFEKHGFEFLSSHYPPFTQEFVSQYNWSLPTDDSEYLIMAMRKKHTQS